MKQILTALCAFAIAAGIWLAVMENILKHAGYAGRSAIAGCIVIQAAATLLSLFAGGRIVFRGAVITGAAAIALLGISAIVKTLDSSHFEGFVLIIGTALTLQGALSLILLSKPWFRGGARQGKNPC